MYTLEFYRALGNVLVVSELAIRSTISRPFHNVGTCTNPTQTKLYLKFVLHQDLTGVFFIVDSTHRP